MNFGWQPLSKHISLAGNDHDIIVVGSGYGGGVAASRLARTGRSVTVLERGREIAPGEYPRTAEDGVGQFQVRLSQNGHRIGPKDGLYDLRIGNDMNVFVGCGLGGTSLINANVAIEADRRVFDDWPQSFPKDLSKYYKRARDMLGSKPYPAGKTPSKLRALEKAAKGLDADVERPDINVNFEAGHTSGGLWQAPCNDCGDCVSGCNYGAKNTVLMNYLPDAESFGAKIYTGAEVLHIEKDGKRWTVFVNDIDSDGARRVLTANYVVLSAGTLGTTEILLRSRSDDLQFSKALGTKFSGNGDVWAFGYNANIRDEDGQRMPVYGVGAGPNDPDDPEHKPGPCITGMIRIRDSKNVRNEMLIEEGVMPGALALGYAAAFPPMAALLGDPFRYGDTVQRLQDAADLGESLQNDPSAFIDTAYNGPVGRTLPFLVMAHDASDGVLRLENDTIVVSWTNAGLDPAILGDAQAVRDACDGIEAEYLPNPLWQDAFGNRVTSVHPLGGCPMGNTVDDGVIDADCRVFDPASGYHDGLYVCDGAALPGAVGVNPHLLITAVAEYAMEAMAQRELWTIDWSPAPRRTLHPLSQAEKKIEITDTLGKVLEVAKNLQRTVDKCPWFAKSRLRKAWEKLGEYYNMTLPDALRDRCPYPDTETFWTMLGDRHSQKTILSPIFGQLIDALQPVQDALVAKDYGKALECLESAFGDFSPGVFFREKMTGRISAIGMEDDPVPTEPYSVAATGEENCVFEADISAASAQAAITPPDGVCKMSNGYLTCADLGGTFKLEGTFKYLVPNTDEIDCWNMIYEGTLMQPGRKLTFLGNKHLRVGPGTHWWRDLTEVYMDVFENGEVISRGILKVGFEDLLEQAQFLDFPYDSLEEDWVAVYSAITDQLGSEKWKLPELVAQLSWRSIAAKAALLAIDTGWPATDARKTMQTAYRGQTFARMGGLVLRCYAGIYSYMMNFPADEAPDALPLAEGLPEPQVFRPRVGPDVNVQLTRFEGGTKGPVVLAGGFGTTAMSFAAPTVRENIVQKLTRAGYDVWLFDYRGSGAIEASQMAFNLDDVALRDWPAALRTITNETGAENVQALVHCIGSMSLFMAVMAGETRVRSIICSQLGPHAITNWFNYAKGDSALARMVEEGLPETTHKTIDAMSIDEEMATALKHGVPVFDPRSPGTWDHSENFDRAVDGALWKVPNFAPVPCNSPTCHRINFAFGPSYQHENLNQETHNAIRHYFGPVHSHPFRHIGQIFAAGAVESEDGQTDYWAKPERLRLPIHFIAGAENPEMLPEATLRTFNWLRDVHGDVADALYSRHVYPEYGHMDCFIGKNASQDIFCDLLRVLDKQTQATS